MGNHGQAKNPPEIRENARLATHYPDLSSRDMTMSRRTEGEKLRRSVADLSSRAESALILWNTQLRERARLSPGMSPNTAADRIVAEEKLRQQLAELEKETAVVEGEYEAKAATVAHWEERCDIAMRHSDVLAAQDALRTHADHAAVLQALESELTVLRTLMKSCREVLEPVTA
jgi:hypothetical protein